MRVAIVRKANAVIVDGKGARVDCSNLLACIHVIEWDSNYGKGHIEYVNDPFSREREYLPNEVISDFSFYEDFIDAWQKSWDEEQEMIRQRQEKFEREQKTMVEARKKLLTEANDRLRLQFDQPKGE